MGVLRTIFAGVPRWVWILLAVALAYRGALTWHAHQVKATVDAAYARGAADRDAHWTAKAIEWKGRIDAINGKLKEQNNETNRAIAGAADALRVRGPGKAACLYPDAAPVAASGHVAADRPGDAAVGPVPGGERPALAAVPWADLVAFAEQHDLNRAEVLTRREADRQQLEAWQRTQGK